MEMQFLNLVNNYAAFDAYQTEIDKLLCVNNNMVWDIPRSSWGRGNVLFWVLSTWFGANLLVQAYWIGTFISGTPNCAFIDESLNSTIE